MISGLYNGVVTHRRLRPKTHRLRYRVFMLLLDLDEVPLLDNSLHLFSRSRFNLFGFHERDHADGSGGPLRGWVETHLATAGIDLDGGSIQLLAMPRVLGYGFNPISVYFCHDGDGRLLALLYEVHNTFGERHTYLIPVVAGEQSGNISQTCPKDFHVSPFMAMGMTYEFRVHPPGEQFNLAIRCSDTEGPMLLASLAARRSALTDIALLSVFFSTPLQTLKVIGGIHWEALRLWCKGLRHYARPRAPERPVSIVSRMDDDQPVSIDTSLPTR
jgi:uncharacterized protein